MSTKKLHEMLMRVVVNLTEAERAEWRRTLVEWKFEPKKLEGR